MHNETNPKAQNKLPKNTKAICSLYNIIRLWFSLNFCLNFHYLFWYFLQEVKVLPFTSRILITRISLLWCSNLSPMCSGWAQMTTKYNLIISLLLYSRVSKKAFFLNVQTIMIKIFGYRHNGFLFFVSWFVFFLRIQTN